jgi:putative aldouronate transport system permease protein
MTVLCAYPLTYNSLKGRKIITFFIIFTMLFGAGLIPTFVLFRNLGLLNNPLVLILPGSLGVFNIILMRNFFLGIPESLKESAEIDGAGPMTILWKIYIPLSLPSFATIGLFVAVGRWNGFQDALFFLPAAREWHPAQLLLYFIQQNLTAVDVQDPGAASAPGWGNTVRAAATVVTMVPILCVYPFIQKYFVKGATLGAVKG